MILLFAGSFLTHCLCSAAPVWDPSAPINPPSPSTKVNEGPADSVTYLKMTLVPAQAPTSSAPTPARNRAQAPAANLPASGRKLLTLPNVPGVSAMSCMLALTPHYLPSVGGLSGWLISGEPALP